jgi:threonine dehydratase
LQSELDKGIVTASAGNHAQGVAFSAKHLGCKAIIVMPTVTPDIKVSAVRRLGAEVVLIGDTFNEASEHALKLSAEKGMPYIPPFDHPLVVAGQGTVGMELVRQVSSSVDLAAVFVPVGGGGLVAGIGAYLKVIRPGVRIVGVEPTGADAMHKSLHKGERVTLDKVDTFADGVAVRPRRSRSLRCVGLSRVGGGRVGVGLLVSAFGE